MHHTTDEYCFVHLSHSPIHPYCNGHRCLWVTPCRSGWQPRSLRTSQRCVGTRRNGPTRKAVGTCVLGDGAASFSNRLNSTDVRLRSDCLGISIHENADSAPRLTHSSYPLSYTGTYVFTCVRTAAHGLWRGGSPGLTVCSLDVCRCMTSLWRRELAYTPTRYASCRVIGGTARAVTAWVGQTVY